VRKTTREGTMPPPKIWIQVWDTLAVISDECGEDDLGKGYLLKYEGWSGTCVEEVWNKVKAEEEGEETCYEYAEEQSYKIIDDEWEPKLRERGYRFIVGGYDHGGLYGRTWALFKKDASNLDIYRRLTPLAQGGIRG